MIEKIPSARHGTLTSAFAGENPHGFMRPHLRSVGAAAHSWLQQSPCMVAPLHEEQELDTIELQLPPFVVARTGGHGVHVQLYAEATPQKYCTTQDTVVP